MLHQDEFRDDIKTRIEKILQSYAFHLNVLEKPFEVQVSGNTFVVSFEKKNEICPIADKNMNERY